ncbi:DUF5133 domain-containing protein [Streptomyces sp. NPDC020489]|uniref:DUF5133 domain-containing protein n=1 Tax=Streptomyces sp. NPDC020489 TaxID=3365077 RepID=UPI0037A05C5E
MLMPLPATLRRLVAEYEKLAATANPGSRLSDLEYTLCVSTGTRKVEAALETARAYLAGTAAASAGKSTVGASKGVAGHDGQPTAGERVFVRDGGPSTARRSPMTVPTPARRLATMPAAKDLGERVGDG